MPHITNGNHLPSTRGRELKPHYFCGGVARNPKLFAGSILRQGNIKKNWTGLYNHMNKTKVFQSDTQKVI